MVFSSILRHAEEHAAGARLEARSAIAKACNAWLALILSACFLLALSLAVPARAAPSFPPLTGRVVDDAHVLSPDVQAELTAKLAALQQKTSRQLVVVTLPSLQGYDIEDFGYQLGRAWGIGQKSQNNGVLFIIAPAEKKVSIEVGYGLEPVLTDTLSDVIIQQQVLPRFRAGDIPGGIVAGTDALVRQLGLDPAAAEASLAQAQQQSQAQAARAQDGPRRHEGLGAIVSVLLVLFVLSAFFRGGRRGGGAGWILPLMFMGGGGFGGRGGDDDFGGGGGGGGGFSGGGGSFGGGGASGGW